MLRGISYGLSGHSYDVRLGQEAKVIRGIRVPIEDEDGEWIEVIELDRPDNVLYTTATEIEHAIRLHPGDAVLATTVEYITVPDNVIAVVHDKSTYARYFVAVQNTLIDAGFEGNVTLEISNHGPCTVDLLVGTGIAQLVFYEGASAQRPYAGKYQGQVGTTEAR